ncbi:transporter, NhaC family [Lachnospiraceae bacterium C10]|nr:transporter, NhaC family [Lachnospiraceae bacterium C10]
MFIGTWWSLLPPIVAILLALLTKEVYISLFAGSALGALFIAGFHPWKAFDILYNTVIESVDFSILMFMILLGMIVMLMQESGGTRAYGEWATKKLKSKRSSMIATSLLGVLIFVDDYFNCLTVGSVMRPVTDKYKVSRAKLAYLIDATAAPVCIIAPISSWAAAVNSYVPKGSHMSGFQMFVSTIPFNLYALLTLYMVFFMSIGQFDFGLMKQHEINAAHGDLFTSGGEAFQNTNENFDPTEGGKYAKGKVYDLIVPMIVMIGTSIAAMIWTGHLNGGTNLIENFANCSSSESLVFAGLVTTGFLLIFYLPRRIIGFKDFMNSVPEGGKLMMPAILILTLAWTLKGITDKMGIGDFVKNVVKLNNSIALFIPVIIFLIAIFIAFSSGTSWGTFAILVPIVVNMFKEHDPTMMIISVSAVLAGAVCGDHISPISDTTIMSSSGAQSNHLNHVRTQFQYAMVVVAVCVPGYLLAGLLSKVLHVGYSLTAIITLLASFIVETIVLLMIRRRSLAADQ